MSARLANAVRMAAELHHSQVRKGTSIPYLSHLLEVASIVLAHGGSENAVIAGLLHDAVEDQGGLTTLELIRAAFGERVAEIVLACSDSTVSANKAPWKQRKDAYLAHLAVTDAEVRLVSAADKLSNARSIVTDLTNPEVGAKVWERFRAGKEPQLWYYGQCAKLLRNTPCGEELAYAVAEMETLA